MNLQHKFLVILAMECVRVIHCFDDRPCNLTVVRGYRSEECFSCFCRHRLPTGLSKGRIRQYIICVFSYIELHRSTAINHASSMIPLCIFSVNFSFSLLYKNNHWRMVQLIYGEKTLLFILLISVLHRRLHRRLCWNLFR